MSEGELIVLGTASQTPTRHRAHNGYIIRIGQTSVLFDPGEGTQRQCAMAGVSIAKLDAVCITHFHGDHCLGLPGVIQRRALDAALNGTDPSVPIYYPAAGQRYLDNLVNASEYRSAGSVDYHPIVDGSSGTISNIGDIEVSVEPLNHRTTTFGYRLQAPEKVSIETSLTDGFGLTGPQIGKLKAEGQLLHEGRTIPLEDVSHPSPGLVAAFIMDTAPCAGAVTLASLADLVVCESTYSDEHRNLAAQYKHMTATDAGKIAAEANAKKLVLSHFSARYSSVTHLENEAKVCFDNTVAANDLDVIRF